MRCNTSELIVMTRRLPLTATRISLWTILSAGVLAVLLLACAGTAAGATWYVDDGGGADYGTIQGAVDVAGAGDTIYVYDGIYNEQVVISASITLSGQSESNVTIDGGGSGDCMQISSSDVTINGFTITNASRYGLYAYSSDLSIEQVTITGNDNYGIYFDSGKSFTLRDSMIDGNGGGITYNGYATGDAVVEDNVITNNVGFGVAICLIEGTSATVKNNKIDNNAGSSSDGIYVDITGSGGMMDIENNPVTKSGRYGVYLKGVRSGSTIANFTVTDSGSVGLYTTASDVNIENVTITDNGHYGVYFYAGKAFTLRNSTIAGNRGGITYDGYATGDAVVEDNIITDNVGFGVAICLVEGKSATVRDNKIDNNAGSSSDGIYVDITGSGGMMDIENNPVTKSGRYGVYLKGVRSGSTIANFTVTDSGSVGLYTTASDVNIENVTITDNGHYGVYFYAGKAFTLRNSTIAGNRGGITYDGYATGDAVVEDNIITDNVGFGVAICLVEGKSATVRDNKIDNNAGSSSDGIYVDITGSGGMMDIENNPVTKSGRYGVYLKGVRSGSTIANFTVTDSGSVGLYTTASDVNIENVTITDNGHYGVYFYAGKAFTLRNSTIAGNRGGITYDGYATGDAVVEDNIITDNVGFGVAICLIEEKRATVKNNIIDNNAGSSSDGIYVYIQGTGGVTTIENNLVEDSGRYGIYLTGATNSTISGNNILKNSYGMRLYSSSNNLIFHNNFIENVNYNANDDGNSNSWDDGCPSAGNYWSDHDGADDFKGPGQNQSGKDGVIDTSYPIQGGSGVDRYPLVNPWPPKGDLNSDHLRTPTDAAIALRIAASGGWDADADVSRDGQITSLDALMILQAVSGGITL